MTWKDKPLYSKIILTLAISLIALNLILAVILPIILIPETESFIILALIIQKTILIPLTSLSLIVALADALIGFTRKKIKK